SRQMPVSWAIFESSFPWPQSILFGQAGFIIRQPVAVARSNSRASITLDWQPGPNGADRQRDYRVSCGIWLSSSPAVRSDKMGILVKTMKTRIALVLGCSLAALAAGP